MTEVIQTKSERVSKNELRELYAKVYAYKEAQKQLDNPELADGYLRYLANTPEDLVKMKVAYKQMYPNEQKGNQSIDRHLKQSLECNPFIVFGSIKRALLKIASLYGNAFNDFLEKLATDEDWFYDYDEEKEKQPQLVQPESLEPARIKPMGQRLSNSFRWEKYEKPYQESPRNCDAQRENELNTPQRKNRKKLFKNKHQVERVSLAEILAERAKEQKSKPMQTYDRDAARLEAYNASVKARAAANMARESFSNQMANINQMAPSSMTGMMMGR